MLTLHGIYDNLETFSFVAQPGLMLRRQGRTSLRRFDGGLLPFGPLLTELSNGRQTNAVAGHRFRSSCREPVVSKSARMDHRGEEIRLRCNTTPPARESLSGVFLVKSA